MADKTWITLSKNGVVDKVFEQNGRPESLQMTNLDANTQYVAQAGLESDGLQSLALQTATFTTLQAGAMSLSLVSCDRSGMNYVATYSYTSTYAPSAAILTRGVGWTYQGVIDSNNHTVTFTIDDLYPYGGNSATIQARLDDIYGESVLSESTTFTVDYALKAFTIKNETNNYITVTITPVGSPSTLPELLRWTGSEWSTLNMSTGFPTDNVIAPSESLILGGDNPNGFNTSSNAYFTISANGSHSINGNFMSLVNKTNYASLTSIPSYSFHHLFKGDVYLTSAANATFGDVVNTSQNADSDHALENTFDGCSRLVYPPNTSKFQYLGNSCMHYTFANCTSLARAASLENVERINRYALQYCYEGCTSLTSGSDLRRVANSDQAFMEGIYYNCSSLATAYYTANAGTGGTNNWLSGCAATGTIYVPTEAVHDAIVNTSVVPSGWTVVVQS